MRRGLRDVGAAAAGLRAWAAGSYAEEAAVELLIRALGGRFARIGCCWVRACRWPGWYWLDTDALAEETAALSSGERRVLAVVQALASGTPLPNVGEILAGVDRHHLALILAAFVACRWVA